MPSPLPSSWTADSPLPPEIGRASTVRIAPFLEAFSFFVAVLFVMAWAVNSLWSVLCKDFSWLPAMSFGRAMAFVVLWGLLFIVVLTMISGARELMTPGAWRKQGWTYKLAESPPAEISVHDERRQAIEQLRHALWHYAAKNNGQLPTIDDEAINAELWNIPGLPGVRFLYVAGQSVDENGRLLAFEPEFDPNRRQVLLTNGMIGEMRSADVQQLLAKTRER
jgi:hypothetical protein